MVELTDCERPGNYRRPVSLEVQRILEEKGRRKHKSKPLAKVWGLLAALFLLNGSIVYGAVQDLQWRQAVQQLPELVAIPGLAASDSAITGIIDPQTLSASYYWTFVVHNSTNFSQEAQLKVLLPQNSTVSRATLWVNGVPQEAAFNSTERVQHAYTWITRMHRDPLLVTQTAPRTISIKAAPVMPHGDMQFRLGITASGILKDGKVEFSMPRVTAANMDVSCRQDVHLTSDGAITSNSSRLQTLVLGTDSNKLNASTPSAQFLCRGNININDLRGLTVSARRQPSDLFFATRATHSNPGSVILAKVVPLTSTSAQLALMKSSSLPPNVKLLKSEDQAFRLSTLWAFGQIEQLAEQNNTTVAGQLATAYRVVSAVSGCTVLENQSDYLHEDLTRDPYQVLNFVPDNYVFPSASTRVFYPPVAETPFQPQAAAGSFQIADEPYNGLFHFSFRGALQSTLSQSFSTVVGQLNALNSYSASSSGASYGYVGYSAPSISGASAASTESQSSNSGTNGGFSNNANLRSYSEKSEAQNRFLHHAIYAAGTVSGAIGNGLSKSLLSSGASLSNALFGGTDKVVGTIFTIDLIALFIVLNIAGPVAYACESFKQSAEFDEACNATGFKAFAWLVLALTIPDISIFLGSLMVLGHFLKSKENVRLREATA